MSDNSNLVARRMLRATGLLALTPYLQPAGEAMLMDSRALSANRPNLGDTAASVASLPPTGNYWEPRPECGTDAGNVRWLAGHHGPGSGELYGSLDGGVCVNAGDSQ